MNTMARHRPQDAPRHPAPRMMAWLLSLVFLAAPLAAMDHPSETLGGWDRAEQVSQHDHAPQPECQHDAHHGDMLALAPGSKWDRCFAEPMAGAPALPPLAGIGTETIVLHLRPNGPERSPGQVYLLTLRLRL